MKSVGEKLKLARLHRHWTPQAAAKATKIKVEQLLDLENDAYNKFASPSYARGFVRIYARRWDWKSARSCPNSTEVSAKRKMKALFHRAGRN